MLPVLAATSLRILMIGNSLTYENDLPSTVERLLDAAGADATVDSVSYANVSLGDQWEKATARKAIAEGKYDVVVLQQGPSAAPENRITLKKDAARFADLIRKSGARPALYMVWPSVSRPKDWDGVDASYTAAAKACDCLLLPAGRAWRLTLEEKGDCPVFAADGFHPSRTGSYLAALVIAAGILEKPPEELAADPRIPEETLHLLQRSATRALTVEESRIQIER